jgi:hypothetical protein
MRLRRDTRATGEVNQAMAAMVVIMICVGAVMAAVHAATASARERSAEERAREQAQICLDAIAADPALQGRGGALSLAKAKIVASGNATLQFRPEAMTLAALRAAAEGQEVLLFGTPSALGPHAVLALRPVSVELDDGRILPGVLRVGVDLS